MPWTISHPAIVLPLRRFTPRPLDFAALVFGSMTPDFGYYIDRFDLTAVAHTLRGSFIACLPTGLTFMLIFYLFCRPICYALPSPHRQALLPICPNFPTKITRWLIVLLSLLLGAWTHNFWDAFTHDNGWFVERIAFLRHHVLYIYPIDVCVYLVLQEVFTVIGFVILAIAYRRWLRRQPMQEIDDGESDTWRYAFWITMGIASVLYGYTSAAGYANANNAHGFLFVRTILFRTALGIPQVIVPLSLVATTVIYYQARTRRLARPRAFHEPSHEV